MVRSKKSKKVATVEVVTKGQPKRRRRNKRPAQRKAKRQQVQTRRGRRMMPQELMQRVSDHGKSFLKCTMAPYDFPGVKFGGVPDKYGGPSFVMRHKAVFNFTGNQTLLFAPTPGVAFYVAATNPVLETTNFDGTVFPDFPSVFGNVGSAGDEFGTKNMEKFRILSHNFELKPTSAVLNNSGQITAARIPGLGLSESVSGVAAQERVQGLQSTNAAALSTMPGAYIGFINDGLFGWAINQEADWEPSNIWNGGNTLTSVDGAAIMQVLPATGGIMGWGKLSPLGVQISGSNASTSYCLLVEQCVEYMPRAGSMMALMAGPSPPHDELALELYATAVRDMPAFCRVEENDGFWDKFLNVVSSVAGALAPVLGPFAPIAGGISSIASGIRNLII